MKAALSALSEAQKGRRVKETKTKFRFIDLVVQLVSQRGPTFGELLTAASSKKRREKVKRNLKDSGRRASGL